MLASLFRRILAHPLTAGLELDDPATTQLRKQIISSKRFLTAIYDEWYRKIAAGLPAVDGVVLELGSGAGHCDRHISNLITSEVFFCNTIRLVADAQRMPFSNQSLRAIVFTNVMHHMPDVCQFFTEASRCLRRGGKILMIEPWVTPWSRFVYTRFHHEPFCAEAADWTFRQRARCLARMALSPGSYSCATARVSKLNSLNLKLNKFSRSCLFAICSRGALACGV